MGLTQYWVHNETLSIDCYVGHYVGFSSILATLVPHAFKVRCKVRLYCSRFLANHMICISWVKGPQALV